MSIAAARVAVGSQVWICCIRWQSLMVQWLRCIARAAPNVSICINVAGCARIGVVLERSLIVAERELSVTVLLLLLLLLAINSQLSLLLIMHEGGFVKK